jgi:hypothetical protein
MSQTVKTLKKIAATEEYQALEAAIKQVDPETILNSYKRISAILEAAEKEVLDKIQQLPRHNKDLDWQRFRLALTARSQTILPHWHWLNEQLKKQKIMEGKVAGFGSKGDPLAKTPEGRIVVIRGATLKEGDKVRFKVVAEGEKLDFGRVLELSPDTFYLILTQDTRERVTNTLNSIKDRINSYQRGEVGVTPSELSQVLSELKDVSELATKLRGQEKERILARVQADRARLLKASVIKFVFEFIAKREEREIIDSIQGNQEQIALALSAPGFFRHQAHLSLKAELLSGDKPKGYPEIVDQLEKNLDSMEKALQLMDLKTKIEGVYPLAKRYLERMDLFFERLTRKATDLAFTLGRNISDMPQIQSSIEEAFSLEALSAELRRVFRSLEEFCNQRGAVNELRLKLGNTKARQAETAIEPYLRRIMSFAFSTRRTLTPPALTH